MRIVLVIEENKLEIKKAITKGWNHRFDEDLTMQDIKSIGDKDDILCAIPYLDTDKIEIEEIVE